MALKVVNTPYYIFWNNGQRCERKLDDRFKTVKRQVSLNNLHIYSKN